MKKIHQTAKNTNLSPLGIQSQQLLKKYHPDWEYKLWTDQDLEQLLPKFPEFETIWDTLEGIQKADIGRYMILYLYGGLYADTDVIFNKSIEPLIKNSHEIYIAPTTPIFPHNDPTMTNFLMYTGISGQLFFKDLLDNVHKRLKKNKHFNKIAYTTGREVLNDTAKNHSNVKMISDDYILNKHCNHTPLPPTLVAYHQGSTTRPTDGSWTKKAVHDINKMECNMRENFGIEGNCSQAPVAFITWICILIILIIVIFCLGFFKS